jgi:hypothetical protein
MDYERLANLLSATGPRQDRDPVARADVVRWSHAEHALQRLLLQAAELALQAIAVGYVYIAQVAMGADSQQTLRAFREAEAYDGPLVIIAVAQGIHRPGGRARAMSAPCKPQTSDAGRGRTGPKLRRKR